MNRVPSGFMRSTAILLLAVILLPNLAVPLSTARAADGGAGYELVTKEYVLDLIARFISTVIIRALTNQIIAWIQGRGNEAFVSDLELLVRNEADQAAGEFLQKVLPNVNLCSPFAAQLRIGLAPRRFRSRVSCTATQALANIETSAERFYRDFTQGGWDALIILTSESNDYAPVALNLLDEKYRREFQRTNQVQAQYNVGQGFLGFRRQKPVEECFENDDEDGNRITECVNTFKPENTTPGKVVSEALTIQTTSGPRQLINADEIDEALLAIAGALIQQILVSSKGLFSASGDYDQSLANVQSSGITSDSQSVARIDEAVLKADDALTIIDARIAAINARLKGLRESCGVNPCSADVEAEIASLELERSGLLAQRSRIAQLRSELTRLKARLLAATDPAEIAFLGRQISDTLLALGTELNNLGISLTGSPPSSDPVKNTLRMIENAGARAGSVISSLGSAIDDPTTAADVRVQMTKIKNDLALLLVDLNQIRSNLLANRDDAAAVAVNTTAALNKIREIDAKIEAANTLLL